MLFIFCNLQPLDVFSKMHTTNVVGSQAMWWRMRLLKCVFEPLSSCKHVCVCAWSDNKASSWTPIISLSLSFSLSLSGEWVRVCVSDLYPEDIILGCSRHRLLQAFIQLLLHGQVSGDGPPNLWTDVMQCPQARLHTQTKHTQVLHFHGITQWPTCLFHGQNPETRASVLAQNIYFFSLYTDLWSRVNKTSCVFMYLQRKGGFGGHLCNQPLFFPLLKLAEIFLDEEGSVELPDCYLIIWKK